MQVQKFPQNVTMLVGMMAGVAINLLCSGVFLIAGACLTATHPISTFVLSYAPLIEGVLIAIPAGAAFRLAHTKRWLAIGLVLGILLQVVVFVVWHQHWLQRYAG